MVNRIFKKDKPLVVFAMSYHNNLFDTIRALSRTLQVKILSPRPISHPIYLLEGVNIQSGVEGFSNLLQHLPRATDYILLKHLHRPRNITPFLIGLWRRARPIVMVQRVPALPRIAETFLMRALSGVFKLTGTRVFAVTKQGYRDIQPYFPNAPYIPACIDVSRFLAPQQKQARKPNTLRLISIAKYQKRKNIPYLLSALDTLIKKYPSITFKLEILGGVVDKSEVKRTQEIVKTMKLENHVTLEQNLSARVVPQRLAAADLFILPANREQLGYAVLEAMASGLPCLVSSDTGAASYIENDKNGYVFDPSPQRVAAAVSNFIEDTSINWKKIQAFGAESLRIIQINHSPEVFLSRFKTLLS